MMDRRERYIFKQGDLAVTSSHVILPKCRWRSGFVIENCRTKDRWLTERLLAIRNSRIIKMVCRQRLTRATIIQETLNACVVLAMYFAPSLVLEKCPILAMVGLIAAIALTYFYISYYGEFKRMKTKLIVDFVDASQLTQHVECDLTDYDYNGFQRSFEYVRDNYDYDADCEAFEKITERE